MNYDRDEAAELLGIKRARLDLLIRQRKILCHNPSEVGTRGVYFTDSDIKAQLDRWAYDPETEPAAAAPVRGQQARAKALALVQQVGVDEAQRRILAAREARRRNRKAGAA